MVPRIPVAVLAGFLGAGKTTVLNALLRSVGDLRLGVVVNDFGSVGIDAMLVSAWTEDSVSAAGGCLCCSTEDGTVPELLAKLLGGRGPRLDAVVIEASGIAEPSALVRQVLDCARPGSGLPVEYGGLLMAVDAVEFDHTRARHPVLDDHVAMADVVLLTKTDLVPDSAALRITSVVRGLNPWAPVVPAANGVLDPRLLFDERPRVQRQLALGEVDVHDSCSGHDAAGGNHDVLDLREDAHLHARYDSVEFVTEELFDPRAFVRFLDSRPSGVFRIKGFVQFAVEGFDQRFVVHTVGAAVHFEERSRGRERGVRLVLIGAGLDGPQLQAELAACVRQGPPETDELAMMGVLRFTSVRS